MKKKRTKGRIDRNETFDEFLAKDGILAETEDAAASLGATRRQVLGRIILPSVLPSVLAGAGLAFARAVGEYGSSSSTAPAASPLRSRASAKKSAMVLSFGSRACARLK